MAAINTNKNAVEIRSELKANGTKVEYIVINGQKIGIMGSVNEADRAAALKTMQDAYVASNGDIMEMMYNLNTIATIEEKAIEPDEMVEICGVDVMLSYTNRKAYTMDGEEITNCNDIIAMPKEATKALLIARAELALN